MMRVLALALLILAATACASNLGSSNGATARVEPAEAASVAAVAATSTGSGEDGGLICRKEIVSGSHFRRKVCTTREQREAMRKSADELLRDVVREPSFVGTEGHAVE
jgi:hypothetical protein